MALSHGHILNSDVIRKENSFASVEACRGSVIIRPLSVDYHGRGNSPSLSSSSINVNSLCLQSVLDDKNSIVLEAMFENCFEFVLSSKSLSTVESLTHEVVLKVQGANSSIPLPSGWWFDGNFYTDVYGSKMPLRPDIDDLCEVYVSKENDQIKLFNEMIDSMRF